MSEIAPNPDTPLVNAYSYNFGKRVRQPGGRRLQTCLPSKGTQGAPACQCYVFNNWGRPDTLTLSFAGFDSCSHQCGTLLDSLDAPGMGPFTLDFYEELDQHFDAATGEWIGGGLEVISGAPSNGNGLSSGLGYSCVWQKTGVGDVIDACAGSGDITATCQIGWDTVAGVFCQIQLTGSVLYYSWTWTHLPVTPGTLDCSGNAPEVYRLAYLLTANTQGAAEYARGVHNATGSPNTFWYEFQAENDGQSCFMFNLDGRNKLDYSRLCQGCSNLGQCDADQPNATVAVVCCPAGKDGPCGTNEVAPPCCCGGEPPPPNECFWYCVRDPNCQQKEANGLACLNHATGQWEGDDSAAGGNQTVTISTDNGQWQVCYQCGSGPKTCQTFQATANPFKFGDQIVAVGKDPPCSASCELSCIDPLPAEYEVTLTAPAGSTCAPAIDALLNATYALTEVSPCSWQGGAGVKCQPTQCPCSNWCYDHFGGTFGGSVSLSLGLSFDPQTGECQWTLSIEFSQGYEGCGTSDCQQCITDNSTQTASIVNGPLTAGAKFAPFKGTSSALFPPCGPMPPCNLSDGALHNPDFHWPCSIDFEVTAA